MFLAKKVVEEVKDLDAMVADIIHNYELKKNLKSNDLIISHSSDSSDNKVIVFVLAIGLVSYFSYKFYQFYMCKPSFETLARIYLYDTHEHDDVLVRKQFYSALYKYGYTSKQDFIRAKRILADIKFLI